MAPEPGAAAPRVVDVARCSSKGCHADAVWALRWNNPRLHTPDRRKVWTACEEHREHLSGFLAARGFLRDVVPVDEVPVDEAPEGEDGGA